MGPVHMLSDWASPHLLAFPLPLPPLLPSRPLPPPLSSPLPPPPLPGVSLSVDAGQVCALVGRSGGGKSTIVHLLMRFYDPTAGRVLIDGQDMRSLNLKSLHLQMGVVAQDTQMWACR